MRLFLHVQAAAVGPPAFAAEVRGVGSLITDAGEFGRVQLLVSLDAGLEREVEDAAGEHGPLHRIGRPAGFEHAFDVLDQASEVMMGPALLKVHQQRYGLGAALHVHRHGEILDQARHQERRAAKTVVVLEGEHGGLLHQIDPSDFEIDSSECNCDTYSN